MVLIIYKRTNHHQIKAANGKIDTIGTTTKFYWEIKFNFT